MLTAKCVEAYQGDIKTLAAAGGEPIGYVDAHGNRYAEASDLREAAAEEGASRGGTHLFRVEEGSETIGAAFYQTSPTTGIAAPIRAPHGSYLIVRVPIQRWLKLPAGLRPEPKNADLYRQMSEGE